MNVLDLSYVLQRANVPGRSSLVAATENMFRATATEAPAGQIVFDLPNAPQGYLRLWTTLTAVLSAPAATDVLRLFVFSRGAGSGTNCTFATIISPIANEQNPLIGGELTNAAGRRITGVLPVVVAGVDQLELVAIITAASGQNVIASGRYLDLPF